jgi:dynein heavy chain
LDLHRFRFGWPQRWLSPLNAHVTVVCAQVFGIMDKAAPEEGTEFSIQDLIDMGVMTKMEEVANVGATASKEWSLLKTLEKMESEWVGLEIKTIPYKDSGTFVIGGTDEIQMILDDQARFLGDAGRR